MVQADLRLGASVDDTGLSSAPGVPLESESAASEQERAPLTRGQGIAIILLLSAILVVGVAILVLLLVRRSAVRVRLGDLRGYLGSRAHRVVQLSGKELEDLLNKRDSLRFEAWEPRIGELLEAPRALIKRF
jgi:hypothetical protein